MNPAGLLVSVATIAMVLDDLTESYNAAFGTLSSIRTQVKILETGAQRIQEWLLSTDPSSKTQIMHNLQDSLATVKGSLSRLRDLIRLVREN